MGILLNLINEMGIPLADIKININKII